METANTIDLKLKDDFLTHSQLIQRSKEMKSEANMVSWHACFYSVRFWQYFLMNALGCYMYFAFFSLFDKAGHGTTSTYYRMLTCPVIAVLYEVLGFRIVHSLLMFLNIAIGVLGLTKDFDDANVESRILYRLSAIVQTGQFILNLAAVPQTFGIKFGCVVLCFVSIGRVLIIILANIIT